MRRRKSRRRLLGPGEVYELSTYAEQLRPEDSSRLRLTPFRAQERSIEKNLAKKICKGDFDKEKAAKAFKYLMDNADKHYVKEFRTRGPHFFSAADRREAAKDWANDFMQRAKRCAKAGGDCMDLSHEASLVFESGKCSVKPNQLQGVSSKSSWLWGLGAACLGAFCLKRWG